MRTNIVLDDKLLKDAFEISNARTKKELIHLALEEYIRQHKAKNLLDLKGKVVFEEGYDYKVMRQGEQE
jgi:Arc/MetJ family transcription regulator